MFVQIYQDMLKNFAVLCKQHAVISNVSNSFSKHLRMDKWPHRKDSYVQQLCPNIGAYIESHTSQGRLSCNTARNQLFKPIHDYPFILSPTKMKRSLA